MLLFIIIGSVFALDVGKVDSFSGKVDKLQRGQVKPQPLTQENIGLSVGDILRTKSDGTVKVSFIDGNNVEPGPLTRLDVIDYETKKTINIIRGRVLFEVTKLKPGEGLEIRTPTAILGVKGTTFLVDVSPTATLVFVLSGTVQITPISNPTTSFMATPGTSYVATLEQIKYISTPAQLQAPLMNEPRRPPVPEVIPPCIR